jgi:hypothetical protein
MSEALTLADSTHTARTVSDDLPLSAVRLRLACRERCLGHPGTVA